MKALVLISTLFLTVTAHAYSPEGTTVTGTTSTATGNDSYNDDDGNSSDYCYPYCNTNYSPNVGGAGTETYDPYSSQSQSNEGDGLVCPVEPTESFVQFMSNGHSKDDIDAFNRKSIKAGSDGFLTRMVLATQGKDHFDLTKAIAISALDRADAAAKPDDIQVYAGEMPDGLDYSNLTEVQKLGVAASVTVVLDSSVAYNYISPTATDSGGVGYAAVTSDDEFEGTGSSLILICKDKVGSQMENVVMHEAFHAGWYALEAKIDADNKSGNLTTTNDGYVKAEALIQLQSLGLKKDSTITSEYGMPALSEDYYEEPMEFFAYCSQPDQYCANYKSVYAKELVAEGMSADAAAAIISDLETDSSVQYVMGILNAAAASYNKSEN